MKNIHIILFKNNSNNPFPRLLGIQKREEGSQQYFANIFEKVNYDAAINNNKLPL